MARSPYPHSDRELLARIRRSSQGKAGYKQLIRELGLGGGRERRLLLEQLTRMVARGDLQKLEEELWAIPRSPSEAGTSASGAPSVAAKGTSAVPRSGRWENFEATTRSGRDRLQSGRLELHRDGFGFVRVEAAKPSGTAPERQGGGAFSGNGDIFIPPNALHGAMHGDLVLVDEDPPARDGRRSGRIARVLTRRNPTIVGIFHAESSFGGRRQPYLGTRAEPFLELRGNYVQPLDERLGGPIEIPEGAEIAAGQADSPHRTLGQEAEAAAALPPAGELPSLDGLAVEVEITSYPQPGRPARGRVVEVLGPPDAFGVDVEIVIRKHAIPHTFPAHVLAEAEEQAQEGVATLAAEELALREDFRDLPIVTIDGETARDFDDAVLVRALPNGNSELQVHIADVGWYVRSGSALDTEARVRGTSVYFPDRAVPMLPHALSSGMCSLLPHEDRLVLSCVMEIDLRGEIAGYRVGEGIIRSARRMTYTSVQRCLNASPDAAAWNGTRGASVGGQDGAAEPQNGHVQGAAPRRSAQVTPEPTAEDLGERERLALEQPELPEAFDRMLELALRLNRKRTRRGSIDFDLPEPVVEFDPEGNMKAIVRSERGWAHRLIEEFMLSANECVATWLTGQGIPSIYRIHEMPDPKRILEFEETAAGFGQTLGIGALPVKRLTMKSDRREAQRRGAQGRDGRPAQAQEIPERIPVTPQMYQRLVRRIQGTPEERILAYLMLRSLKQARYAEKNEGHFALASPCYTHFTSPIRRYPDLIVHRLLRTMLRSGADARGGAILSGDPQPWAAELARSRGQHAGAALRKVPLRSAERPAPASTVSFSRPALAQSAEAEQPRKRFTRTKRPGRIGWSEETLPNGAETVAGIRSRTQEGTRELKAENDFVAAMLQAEATQRESERELEDAEEEQNRLASSEREARVQPDQRLSPEDDAEAQQLSAGRAREPISAEELADIALESSQAERRAADAERELIEWKKMKFMAGRIGEDFRGIILSVTKFGFFVELDELFIEGLVPLGSLTGDFYSFRDTDRTICGVRTGHCFRVGDRVDVILDRIDRQQRRLQFALTPGTEPAAAQQPGSLRAGKSEAKKARAEARRLEKLASKSAAPVAKKPKAKAKKAKKARKRKEPL